MTVQFRGFVPPVNADFLPNQQSANQFQANVNMDNSIFTASGGPSSPPAPAGCGGNLNCSA